MSCAFRRLKKEYQQLQEHPDDAIRLEPVNDDFLTWEAAIRGPDGTPYEGGRFIVGIIVPLSYPFVPPKVHFKTRVYHPNISNEGRICLDLLKKTWSPALTLSSLLMSLISLLGDPNPDDPLVFAIADTYKNNRQQYNMTARHWTHAYATDKMNSMTICGL